MRNLNLIFVAIVFAIFTLTSCQKEGLQEMESLTEKVTTEQLDKENIFSIAASSRNNASFNPFYFDKKKMTRKKGYLFAKRLANKEDLVFLGWGGMNKQNFGAYRDDVTAKKMKDIMYISVAKIEDNIYKYAEIYYLSARKCNEKNNACFGGYTVLGKKRIKARIDDKNCSSQYCNKWRVQNFVHSDLLNGDYTKRKLVKSTTTDISFGFNYKRHKLKDITTSVKTRDASSQHTLYDNNEKFSIQTNTSSTEQNPCVLLQDALNRLNDWTNETAKEVGRIKGSVSMGPVSLELGTIDQRLFDGGADVLWWITKYYLIPKLRKNCDKWLEDNPPNLEIPLPISTTPNIPCWESSTISINFSPEDPLGVGGTVGNYSPISISADEDEGDEEEEESNEDWEPDENGEYIIECENCSRSESSTSHVIFVSSTYDPC